MRRRGTDWSIAAVVMGLLLSAAACNGGGDKESPDYRHLPEDTATVDETGTPDVPLVDRQPEPELPEPEICSPACDGLECGDDGCGGICGQCEGNQDICEDGLCVCVPACAGKECGDDGCGGICNECDAPFQCVANKCECEPDCEGKECGYDGCFGECGSCLAPYACQEGGLCGCAYGACAPEDDPSAVCGGTSLGNCGFWACGEMGCCVVEQTPPPDCCQVSEDCRDCINLETAEVVACPDEVPEGFVTHKCTKDVCGQNQCKHFDMVVFGDCNDNDPCTEDSCKPSDGLCTHTDIPDCVAE